MIWSIFKENFLQNIIEEMKINVRGNFSEFKMISLIPINKLRYFIVFNYFD